MSLLLKVAAKSGLFMQLWRKYGIGGELHVLPPELYEKPGRRYNLQQQGHDDLRGRPQGFPPSSREVPLQRRGVQVPTALHQERPRDRLGEL